jgi:hypothetical protein
VLHLAPRSVRDLIYSGRLPSLRIGRLHYVRATDLELERRRRLGLRAPRRPPRPARARVAVSRPRAERPHVDPALRRQRAAERAAVVSRWAERHQPRGPRVPFTTAELGEQGVCAACGRALRAGARTVVPDAGEERLCLTCGRRAILDWADQRRLEAASARRMAHELGAAADTRVA